MSRRRVSFIPIDHTLNTMPFLMRFFVRRATCLSLAALMFAAAVTNAKDVTPPKIFLDKSPRIVAYQLGRLDDERLLLVPRSTNDKKYIPVYEAIVGRPAIAAGIREDSLQALAELNDTSIAAEIVAALSKVEPEDAQSQRLVEVLTRSLLAQPKSELSTIGDTLTGAVDSDPGWLRAIAMAALITSGKGETARKLAASEAEAKAAYLGSIEQLTQEDLKNQQLEFVIRCFENAQSAAEKRSAIAALSRIPTERDDTYERLIALVDDPAVRTAACRGLLRLPREVIEGETALKAVRSLVKFAEATEASQRTTDSFIDAMQMADRLLANVPTDTAKQLRGRLREITVRVVRIGTVEEEMRYDVRYFAVEAGRPVQILLENHDLMPHNLVVTAPGALKAVALAGQAAGPAGSNGLPYVPDSPNVLAASPLIGPDESVRITLTAPTEPGEYPYVCTFPQHWYRMYGVMVVVNDLDAWNKNPVEPHDPIGSNRSFVNAWKMDDFAGAFETDLRGRSPQIGEKIFNEASCIGCHKINGVGGAVGPELTDVYKRWKSDHTGILREILEPSHKIDNKYAMQTILTVDGKTMSGIVIDENDETLTLLSNPDAKEPEILLQDDIELIKRSATSMMPKALMDQYTKDEILEMLAYLKAVAQ